MGLNRKLCYNNIKQVMNNCYKFERRKDMKSKYAKKSYIEVICFGAIIGLITELLNFYPNDDLWGWCILYIRWKPKNH